MKKNEISAWEHPAIVFIVDDNSEYLKRARLSINTQYVAPKLFSSPTIALEELDKYKPENPIFIRAVSNSMSEDSLESQGISVNLKEIAKEIYNPDRFNELAVIIVDYAMAGMNGIEYCREVRKKNSHVKILMLTGEADEKLAVGAFNEGLIERFMRKDVDDFKALFNSTIRELLNAYYQELANLILTNSGKNPIKPAVLSDPVFINFFEETCKDNNIIEHYLADSIGSFFLLDRDGNPCLLIVKDEESMEDTYQVAFHADEEFPAPILREMKNREKILCIFDADYCDDPGMASKFMRPAKILNGQKIYYYALIKDLQDYGINKEDIYSYKSFLENLSSDINEIT